MEMISWTDGLRNEVLQRVKEEINMLHTMNRRKANWICHILLRNCLLRHFIEGKIEGTGGGGRRGRQLLNDLKEKRRYLNLQEEALYLILCRTSRKTIRD
jgi:hypothetical protein